MKNNRSLFRRAIALALTAALLCAVVTGCGQKKTVAPQTAFSSATTDLLKDKKSLYNAGTAELTPRFATQYNAFALSLLRQTAAQEAEKKANQRGNYMLSPLSVLPALVMTANGADGDTLAQMEQAIGGSAKKSMTVSEWNDQLGAFLQSLPSGEKAKLSMGNSIWLKDGAIQPEEAFLNTNAAHFNADIFTSKFDRETVGDINFWVSQHTDGMIDKMLDEIGEYTLMYLINALTFDAEWERIYDAGAVHDGAFHGTAGDSTVPLMYGDESTYLQDELATGFSKPYAGGYRFVAMLPNEGVTPEQYIASPQFGKLRTLMIQQEGKTSVDTVLPKFSSDYSAELNDALKAMGMTDAFDGSKADFTRMGKATSGNPLYISMVLHKTFISVDERGTKAGAATVVGVDECAAAIRPCVRLDRPFVYMIVDNENHLPLFIGVVNNITQ